MFGRKAASSKVSRAPIDPAHDATAVAVRQTDVAASRAGSSALADHISSMTDAGDGFVHIGRGTRITGEIGNCSVIEIEGTLEGNVSASILIVREGGMFKGEAQAEQAEIYGTLDGRATVHGLLDVRASGRVTGDVAYETLSVAAGAHLSGSLNTPAAIDGRADGAARERAEPYAMNGQHYHHPQASHANGEDVRRR